MKRLIWVLFFGVLSIVIIESCQKEIIGPALTQLSLPASPFDYSFSNIPPDLRDFTPTENPQTDQGATLGRVLFYDKKLSINNRIACASCHLQKNAFADPISLSKGFHNSSTKRNSSHIVNARFQPRFFWDMRARTLEEQVLLPIQDHIEMGMEELDNLEIKLARVDYYPGLFKDAFGTEDITQEKISKAISQFLRSMVSFGSKFDDGSSQNFTNFSPLENMGRELFFNELHCGSCHNGSNFAEIDLANIGLEMEYADDGAGGGRFKIPSLRNVELTAPYMHDGRYTTLEQVVDLYNEQVVAHPFLNRILMSNGLPGGYGGPPTPPFGGGGTGEVIPAKLLMTDLDKKALVAFLKTLTDMQFITDPRFSNPFK